jgi:hypothetical protein
MFFADAYFSKQKGVYTHISEPPSYELRYVVVIPACREEHIRPVLDSLWHCMRPAGVVEVLVVVNAPDTASDEIRAANQNTLAEIESWRHTHHEDRFRCYAIDANDLPSRHAGVGLARKIGMDEAVWRFNRIGRPGGLIVSLDADCLCDKEYFKEFEKHLDDYPNADGFNVYFEHPLSGDEFPARIYLGIMQYELHLRYYVQALRYAGFPYAFHTVGSCYAVKASSYVKQGGMNRRKSGEDFYFLQKIFPLGNFFEINTTRVIPSPRPSLRVPFGTGPAMHKYLLKEKPQLETYHPDLFEIIRRFFSDVPKLFRQPPATAEKLLQSQHPLLRDFLSSAGWTKTIAEINSNCSSQKAFTKRFFRWFDGLLVLRFLNFASFEIPRIDVCDAAVQLLHMAGQEHMSLSAHPGARELLMVYREMERREAWVSHLPQ